MPTPVAYPAFSPAKNYPAASQTAAKAPAGNRAFTLPTSQPVQSPPPVKFGAYIPGMETILMACAACAVLPVLGLGLLGLGLFMAFRKG